MTSSSRLAFDAPKLSFGAADELPGYDEAVRIFRAMGEGGYAVRVTGQF